MQLQIPSLVFDEKRHRSVTRLDKLGPEKAFEVGGRGGFGPITRARSALPVGLAGRHPMTSSHDRD